MGATVTLFPAAGSVATYSAVGLRPWVGFLVGWGYSAVEILIVPLVMSQLGYTVLANANAGANVFTRTAFAFGRVGVFPRALAQLDPKFKSPRNAIVLQLILGLIIGLGLGVKYTPQLAFGVVATGLVIQRFL